MIQVALLSLLICVSLGTYSRDNPSDIIQANDNMRYQIVGKYPRAKDQLFFTEGLSFAGENTLMESSGLYGDSEIHFITDVFSSFIMISLIKKTRP